MSESSSSSSSSSMKKDFVSEFANKNENATFSFSNLFFQVDDKKYANGRREILSNINGEIKAGQLLAILGPSGSGKTTVLNMLTLASSIGTGHAYGNILLNNETMSRSLFVKNCYYVPQEDNHYAFLTPREALTYAAKLFHNDGNDNIERRVNTLLTTMGLDSCADTKVGNAFFQGLSGGQKKRLSIAYALLSRPLVLFLDEPTSGLDSAASSGIMSFLRELASSANIMIICTIHQPSAAVFNSFDKVMLLANGKQAYTGTAKNVVSYFSSIGYVMPSLMNPAEFIVDLVNDAFTPAEKVNHILNSWTANDNNNNKNNAIAKAKKSSSSGSDSDSDNDNEDSAPVYSTSFWSQLTTLFSRHGLLTMRDPLIYAARTVIYFIMGVFFSIIYISMRDRTQTQVFNRMWVVLWYVGPASSLAVIAVYAYNLEYKSIRNEIKNGMTNPLAYVCANTILQIPLMWLMTFVGFSIPMYGISNLQPEGLPLMITILALTFWVFESLGQMLAYKEDNFLMGMLGVMNFWFSCFLFAGMMVSENDVPWPFRIFNYALPFSYALESMAYTEFHGTSFSGAVFNASQVRQFSCPGISNSQCYGYDGDTVLDSLHVNWNTFSSTNNVARDIGILIGWAVFFKILSAIYVYNKGTAIALPKKKLPPSSATPSASGAASGENSHNDSSAITASIVDISSVDKQEQERRIRQDKFTKEFKNNNINATFQFQNMYFTVDDKNNKNNPSGVKQIIKGVSGKVSAGELLVIMGPSGAGKTTLLNILTLEKTVGKSYGNISLNGQELTQTLFNKYCYYVPQYATHYAFLTPRETLTFAAELFTKADKNDNNKQHIHTRVDTLIEALGLNSCADTKIGNEFFVGLSGGEKKRLAIGVALLSNPLVLFLDEPTTGLDSAAAAGVMKILKDLAHNAHILVVCTIHQPSAAVFQGFDNIMLLARGQTAYCGPSDQVGRYFSRVGHDMPNEMNPAEFMLDLVNDEFTDKLKVRQIVDAWGNYGQRFLNENNNNKKNIQESSHSHADSTTNLSASFFSQFLILIKRQGILITRDPMIYLGRMVASLFSNVFFTIIYISARDRAQSHVIARMFDMMWCIGTPASFALLVVFTANREMLSIKNEVKNGMIKPFAYLFANLVLEIPLLFLITLVAYLVPYYGMLDSDVNHMGEMIVTITCVLWSFESIAQMMAVQNENFLVGMLNFQNMWFSSFLFAGVVVKESDVPWPFKIFMYISPLRYGLQTIVYLDTIDESGFGGAQLKDDGTFICPDDTSGGVGCYGYNGQQVLDSLNNNFQTFSSTDRTAFDIGILIVLAVGFKLMYFMMLYMKAVSVADKLKSSDGLTPSIEKTTQIAPLSYNLHDNKNNNNNNNNNKNDLTMKTIQVEMAATAVTINSNYKNEVNEMKDNNDNDPEYYNNNSYNNNDMSIQSLNNEDGGGNGHGNGNGNSQNAKVVFHL